MNPSQPHAALRAASLVVLFVALGILAIAGLLDVLGSGYHNEAHVAMFLALGALLVSALLIYYLQRQMVREYVRAESARRASEILNIAGEPILAIDEQQRIVFFNESAEQAFGYSAGELTGRPLSVIIPERFVQQHVRRVDEFMRLPDAPGNRRRQLAITARCKDGREFPAEATISRYAQAGQLLVVAVIEDITERKLGEAALRASEAELRASDEELRALFAAMDDVIIVLDADGRYLRIAPTNPSLLYRPADDLIGRCLHEVLPRDKADELLGYVRRALAAGHALNAEYSMEIGGADVHFSTTISPMQDGSVMWLARDITERKRAEKVQQATYRISEAAQAAPTLEELFHSIHAIISGLMPAKNFFIALRDEATQTVGLSYFVDEYDDLGSSDRLGRGLAAYVLRSGRPLLASREKVEELIRQGEVELIGPISLSWLGVPLTAKERVLGVLVVQSYCEGLAFGESDKEILEFVSSQVAMAIERKRAEEALAQERNLLRTLIDNLPDHIYAKDRNSSVILSNLANAQVTGMRSPDEVVGRTDFDLYPRELAERYYADDQAVITSGRPLVNREEPIVDSHGNSRWTLTNKMPLRDLHGEIVGLVGIGRDITQHKQRERELSALVSVAAVLRTASTPDEMLPQILDQVLSLFPLQGAAVLLRDPVAGDLVTMLAYGIWAQQEGRRQMPGDGIAGQVLFSGQVCVSSEPAGEAAGGPAGGPAGGTPRSAAWVPLSAYEQPIGVLGVVRDAPLLEEDLRLLTAIADIAANALYRSMIMAMLEQRVAERTRELAEANERLQELDRLKSKFVSDVSHELRTPVTNLKLYLNLFERGRTDKRAQYMSVIKDQTDRLGSLIEAILDLSHLESEREQWQRVPLDLNALVSQSAGELHARAEAARLELRCELELRPLIVLGDRGRLSQVVTNLISNAINYTPSGSVSISTRWAALRGQACLEVQDTGIGVDGEDLPHIFERFYRGRRAAQSNIPGTGLGLAIVKEIVDLHGGQMEVDSRPGQGSTFRMWLPLV